MVMPNNERIDRALDHLVNGLRPKCEETWQGVFGDDWLNKVNQKLNHPDRKPRTEDPAFLFKAMKGTWYDIFAHAFSQQDKNYVYELAEARHKWAHREAVSSDDTLRVLDSAERLLESFGDQDNRLLIQELRRGLMRQMIEGEARAERRKTAKVPTEGEPQAGLTSWRDLVAPHDDVASGRLTAAEFAADLSLVAAGKAGPEYQDPKAFFARTYLTTRLTGLLTEAALRLSGQGGQPAIELQTNFGGGKTHALIALYHLAGGTPVSELAGVAELLARDGNNLKLPADIKRAVIVGPDISPTRPQEVADDIKLHTLWGHLAWQLGGREGYEMVRAADEGVDGEPGNITQPELIALFEAVGPSLILIDEWVAYARQLRDDNPGAGGSFGTQFTFAQALLGAAKAVDNVMVLVTLPQSEVEVGGEQGVRALAELKEVTKRDAQEWLDQQTDESFEIVRRRLFEPITAENARIRDGVIRAFQEMYRNDQKSFPAGCHDDNFRRRMEMSYPIHPELFDRLFEDWSTLDGFQRTRGALRLMSLVISELWNRGDTSLMIMPGTLPLDSGAVAAELRKHLKDGWDAVIQSNVDGPAALPTSLDQNNKHFGRLSATRRVARSVYIGSAPRTDGSNGVNINSVMLGSTQPGEPVRQFEDALRRLANEATHLHNSGSQYWYSLSPTLGREAASRAESEFGDLDADAELRRRLSEEIRSRGSFAGGVQVFAEGPGDVPDDDDGARLVILSPNAGHGSGTTSAATELAEKILNQRDGGPRVNRNLLVFVAATQARVDELRMSARRHLAWKSIERDKKLDLKESEKEQVQDKIAETSAALESMLADTFVQVLVPTQEAGTPDIRWTTSKATSSDPIAERVSKKLASSELLISKYAGTRLKMDLDRYSLWSDRHDISVAEVWANYCRYPHMTRLASLDVLTAAISDGTSNLNWASETFAYAEAHDDTTWVGVRKGEHVSPDRAGLLIEPEHLPAEEPPSGGSDDPGEGKPGPGGGEGKNENPGGDGTPPEGESGADTKRNYYALFELDTVRGVRDLGAILESVTAHLGPNVELSLEVRSTSNDGYDDRTRRTVSENAGNLGAKESAFE